MKRKKDQNNNQSIHAKTQNALRERGRGSKRTDIFLFADIYLSIVPCIER
jgi:hypothetical protein